jgi:hypothetical protein
MVVLENTLTADSVNNSDIERIHHAWGEALSNNDMKALIAQYAPTRNWRDLLCRICRERKRAFAADMVC